MSAVRREDSVARAFKVDLDGILDQRGDTFDRMRPGDSKNLKGAT